MERLVVREPEVDAVQDPYFDDVLRSVREAVVLLWVFRVTPAAELRIQNSNSSCQSRDETQRLRFG